MSEPVLEKLDRIEKKIDSLKKTFRQYVSLAVPWDKTATISTSFTYADQKEGSVDFAAPVNVFLLKLPDSLRKTMLAMSWLGKATSSRVAKITGRSRSIENTHLNQLERMGYLVKFRVGKRVYFKLPKARKET